MNDVEKGGLAWFLREHLVGVFLFAIITGVVGNFVYDRLKPEPRAAKAAADNPVPEQAPAPRPDAPTPRAVAPQPQPVVLDESRRSTQPAAVPSNSGTPQRSRTEELGALNSELDAAKRAMDQQLAHARLRQKGDENAAERERGDAMAKATEQLNSVIQRPTSVPENISRRNAEERAAQRAYGNALADIGLKYDQARATATSHFQQAEADIKTAYDARVRAAEARYQAKN